MHASSEYLQPETLQRIARLDLRARRVVEGFLSGMHRSPYFGQSVEFLQHREYTPGDELRHIDWKVWARQNRLYVKQFEEDTNLRAHFLVDVSNSMRYGRQRWNKHQYAATVAASLAYLLLRQQDAVSLLTFDAGVRQWIPPRGKMSQLDSVVRALEQTEPADASDLEATLVQAAEKLPRSGMLVLVSDLLVARPGLFKGLRLLRQRGHDMLVLHVLDDDELDFPFQGWTRFESLEGTAQLNCNSQSLRDGYLKAIGEYLEEIQRGCAQLSIEYVLLRTGTPLDRPLTAFLNRRRLRHSRHTAGPRKS